MALRIITVNIKGYKMKLEELLRLNDSITEDYLVQLLLDLGVGEQLLSKKVKLFIDKQPRGYSACLYYYGGMESIAIKTNLSNVKIDEDLILPNNQRLLIPLTEFDSKIFKGLSTIVSSYSMYNRCEPLVGTYISADNTVNYSEVIDKFKEFKQKATAKDKARLGYEQVLQHSREYALI